MSKAVRFSQFGGPEVLEIVDLPDPHPGPGQVRIAVRAAGVNPSDWKKRKGLMNGELPQTMGHEAAGVVDELGEGVADVAAGDRVFGFCAEGAAQAELAVWRAGARGDVQQRDAGRAVHALAEIAEMIESGRFSLPVARTFPLAQIAEAHRVSQDGHVRGKLVLVVGSPTGGSR